MGTPILTFHSLKIAGLADPLPPYEAVVRALCQFRDDVGEGQQPVRIGWMRPKTGSVYPYPPALESRGLSLKSVVFLETDYLQASFQALADEDHFHVLVVEGKATAPLLQMARKWIRPAAAKELMRADALAALRTNKLVIFIE